MRVWNNTRKFVHQFTQTKKVTMTSAEKISFIKTEIEKLDRKLIEITDFPYYDGITFNPPAHNKTGFQRELHLDLWNEEHIKNKQFNVWVLHPNCVDGYYVSHDPHGVYCECSIDYTELSNKELDMCYEAVKQLSLICQIHELLWKRVNRWELYQIEMTLPNEGTINSIDYNNVFMSSDDKEGTYLTDLSVEDLEAILKGLETP